MTDKQLKDIWDRMSKYEENAKKLRELFLQEYLKKKRVPEDIRSRYAIEKDNDDILIERDGGARRWRGSVDEILSINNLELQ